MKTQMPVIISFLRNAAEQLSETEEESCAATYLF